MKWSRQGFGDALRNLVADLADAAWPKPPAGFVPVEPARPMRVVLRGTLEGPEGRVPVAVKWSRPVTAIDRLARHARGGKGPREGRMLRRLEDAGVPAVRALGYTDEGADTLVTAWATGLEPLGAGDSLSRADFEALAALVRATQEAGVRHNDLHLGNVLREGAAFRLVDLGRARAVEATDPGDPAMLARLAHGLGPMRRSQRLRALRAWLRVTGCERTWRGLVPRVERRLQARRRHFLKGRDRRATREGTFFHVFSRATAPRAIRALGVTDPDWEPAAETWLGETRTRVALKAGGGVVRVAAPGGRPVVVKRYASVAAGRLPRPLRAFRIAEALRNRGIDVPRPLLAAAREDGSGVVVSAWIDAPDLHVFFHGGGYEALPPTTRHRLLEYLGRTLRKMHDAEVRHRDTKAPNLLVDATTPRVWICDVDGAARRPGPIPWGRRMKDLARLDASLPASRTDRLRLFSAYVRVPPSPPVDRRRLLARIAHHVAKKRGPSNEPR